MSEHQQSPDQPQAPSSPEIAGAVPPADSVTNDDRNLALLIHILAFFTSVIAPLIIWLLKKDQSRYLDHHGKQAINFQITVLIGYAIAMVTSYILIGCFILPVVFILDVVFCIIAAMAASKGEWYRYPIAIPLLK